MFFSKSPQGELIFLIEIQSSAVRGSLVLLENGHNPNILFTAHADMSIKPGISSSYLVKTTLRAVTETIEMLARRHHALVSDKTANAELRVPSSVHSVHFVLSSPWIISQAKTVNLTFPKEIMLSKAKILETIEAERSKLSTEETQTEIVEEKIFDVRINGYSVAAWENRPALNVDVSFVVSLSGANLSRRLRESCERIVRKNHVHFHSALLLEAMGIGIAMPEAESFTLVNIHGGLTEVTVVREKRCVFFGSYPLGVDTIIYKVAKSAKTDEKAADSLMSLLAEDDIDPTHGKPLKPLVSEIMGGWAAEFVKLTRDAVSGPLPTETFIAAREHEKLFIREFEHANPKTKVTSFAIDRLLSQVTFDPHTERRRAIGLVILAINSLGDK